jgi:hypothetical protein
LAQHLLLTCLETFADLAAENGSGRAQAFPIQDALRFGGAGGGLMIFVLCGAERRAIDSVTANEKSRPYPK